MSAVEIFVVIVAGVLGYLAVAHFMSPKPVLPPSSKPVGEVLPGWAAVLEVARDASPEEIRKAYQTQITKYHPDKVAHLGDEFKEVAHRKSQEINDAYAAALRERG